MQNNTTYNSNFSVKNYHPFGMTMSGRSFTSENYRFGFNGMEKDNEVSGNGNSYTTHFRAYDPRIARWKSVDPITHPHQSPYVAFDNNPIYYTDPRGSKSKEGNATNDKENKEQARYNKKFNEKVVDVIQKEIDKIENPSKTDLDNIANNIEDKYVNKEWFRFGLKNSYSVNNTTGEKTAAKDVHLRDNLYTTIYNSGEDYYEDGASSDNPNSNMYILPQNGTYARTTITDKKFNSGVTKINVDAKLYPDKVDVYNVAKDGTKSLIGTESYIGTDGFGAKKPAIILQNSQITNRQIQVVVTSINSNVTRGGLDLSVAEIQVTTIILDPQPIYNITKMETSDGK